MATIVNLIGMIVVGLCAVLLLRAYASVRRRMLLWSGLCFAGLAASGALAYIDLELMPTEVNLYTWRLGIAAVSQLLLVYGLLWENE
jgi:Family of unknown function (DUF5985)